MNDLYAQYKAIQRAEKRKDSLTGSLIAIALIMAVIALKFFMGEGL